MRLSFILHLWVTFKKKVWTKRFLNIEIQDSLSCEASPFLRLCLLPKLHAVARARFLYYERGWSVLYFCRINFFNPGPLPFPSGGAPIPGKTFWIRACIITLAHRFKIKPFDLWHGLSWNRICILQKLIRQRIILYHVCTFLFCIN